MADTLNYVYDAGIRRGVKLLRNLPTAALYEYALRMEPETRLSDTGALCVSSVPKTGRSPTDKRVVTDPGIKDDVWWGPVNMPMDPETFKGQLQRAIDYLNQQPLLFVIDTFTSWDPKFRHKVRIVTTRAYHAIFIKTMLIEPSEEDLKTYGKPDFVIYNAGKEASSVFAKGVTSPTSVSVSFARHEMVILGTEYAGEMKKGVLTVMMYLLPKMGHLMMHASANEGMKDGDVSVFFGLSGTGKTTLSADVKRKLIGDDEHVWTDEGIFNIEGGCYAKAVGLSLETEPEIYNAIKFGCIVENMVMNPRRELQYNDISITENTRCAYPLSFIPNAKIPAVAGHPKNIILLTNDAFGCLPPVAKLTPEQAMYQFVSGYTAKVAGTEMGIKEPVPTFSPCFGGPFLVLHPTEYAKLLAEKMTKFKADCWLVNTGWSGGPYGVGKRMKLKITRAILDAIHDGSLRNAKFTPMPGWGILIPQQCANVPSEILTPVNTWADKKAYAVQLNKLAGMFRKNFAKYEAKADPKLKGANPQDIPLPSKL